MARRRWQFGNLLQPSSAYRVVVAAVVSTDLGLAAFSLTGNVMSSVLTVYTGPGGFRSPTRRFERGPTGSSGFDWIALL